MIVSRYFCLFIIYSVMGWIYESIFCTIKGKKWENRGFLLGPLCPIYGVGAVTISIIMTLVSANFSGTPAAWQIFLVAFFGSIVLEYTTSLLLEVLFHAIWWDYSKQPLNLHGRVCFFASLGFGLAGIVVVNHIAPATERVVDLIPPLLTEVLSLIFMAIFAMDLALTVSALTSFERNVRHLSLVFNENMDTLVETAKERTHRLSEVTAECWKTFNSTYRLAVGRVEHFRYPTINNERVKELLKEARDRWANERGIKKNH